MRTYVMMIGILLLFVPAKSSHHAQASARVEPTYTSTSTPWPGPPPTPTVPTAPDVSGTWDVTRWWFRRCPRCSELVARGTTWEVFQDGHTLRVDRGLRGTINGYAIQLEGIESDGFSRFDFYYSRLYLSPDGLRITGEFVGSETTHNPCAPSPPVVTCFAHGGYLHAIRRSPVPTSLPSPTPGPSLPARPTPTATGTPTLDRASPTPSPSPSPTEPSAGPASTFPHYLPLVVGPSPPTAGGDWPPTDDRNHT